MSSAPTIWKQKYVAEGFKEDAESLLKDFVEESSVEFSVFAEIWKKHHFSLIFMGRPDQTETTEFTNEAYRISMHFMSSSSFYQRVGTVYLLYALYRNQIADPPVKIRILFTDWKLLKNLHNEARLHQHRTLHYVIDYLIKNALMFVATQSLKGPLIGSIMKMQKDSDVLSSVKTTYKSNITEYSVQNNLKELRDLHCQYLEIKKSLDSQVKVTLNNDFEMYDSLISDLDKLVNPPVKAKKERSESVGARRAQIKAESFLRKTVDRFGQTIEDDGCVDDPNADLQTKVVTRKKESKTRRKPKHERKVGRPSKKPKIVIEEEEKSDDDNIDISHLINQQNDFFLPPDEEGAKGRCKPGRYYYKLSPKRDGSESSDPDS